MRYWLMKSEPDEFSINDLARAPRHSTAWFGVRNYQARNFMRDEMKRGDRVLFYASNADPSGVTGVAEISREAYADQFARKKGHEYYDEKATAENPIWYMVDIGFVEKFPHIVPLETLKSTRGLEEMVVTRKGSRLSIQPVTKSELEIVAKMGRGK
jgi:predicted RNA-binding protein with PUA-like domain